MFAIQSAAEWTAFGCFWTNGQICSATSRLIVHVSMENDISVLSQSHLQCSIIKSLYALVLIVSFLPDFVETFQESIAAAFLEKLVKWCENIKISNPLEEGCRLGPVVSAGQVSYNPYFMN